MEAFVAVDVAIGLVFMYLLLSILCTALNEWVAGLLRLRAKTLRTAVSRLVDTVPAKSAKETQDAPRLSTEIFNHPLIESIKDGKRGPSYIPAPRFVAALKDTMRKHEPAQEADASNADSRHVDKNSRSEMADTLVTHDVAHVHVQLDALRATTPPRVRAAAVAEGRADSPHDDDDRMEEWFNQAMERASGWYKRRVMIITVALAILITVVSNADTLVAARILWRNPAVRSAVVTQAQERAKRPRPTSGIIQADYPDKDRPVSGTASVGGEAESAERERASDDESPESDTGLTPDEQTALGQIIGWEREFKEINTQICAIRQKIINEACKPGQEASDACRKAVDAGTADGACVQGSNGLEPTAVYAGAGSIFPFFWVHLIGWSMTAIAVSIGAPFWFDTLKLFMSVRSSGKNPDEKK
jgi:hypothetical protein